MNEFLLVLFWIVLGLIINAHFIYPVFLTIIAHFFAPKRENTAFTSGVSIIIAVYNEEKFIAQRIENLLKLDYDQNKIEILIGSDASSDHTNDILKEFAQKVPNLRIFLFPERRGKVFQLNDMAKEARYPILVFSDANTIFHPQTLARLINPFVDARVGGVSGRLVLKDEKMSIHEGVEEKVYWEIEQYLKTAEGKLGILIGATGGVYAMRKDIYSLVPPLSDDFYIGLEILRQGYQMIYEPKALAFEEIPQDIRAEFSRKKRVASLDYPVMMMFPSLLFNKNLLLSYAFWSHKITRWFLSHLLLLLFILSALLSGQSLVMLSFLLLQVLFYIFAGIGHILSKKGIRLMLFSLPYYFVLTNVAFFLGFIIFLRRKQSVVWQSTQRI
jgi:cellulose synthase/poly-beta-1,6-N-acetylglucosamine synthase-like glycosyltransferase